MVNDPYLIISSDTHAGLPDAEYEQYLDPDAVASAALEVTSMPTTVVIDADGTIVARHSGAMDQDALEAAIDEALDG